MFFLLLFFPRMQSWSFVVEFLFIVVAEELDEKSEEYKKKNISNKSLKLWKVPIKTFVVSLFSPVFLPAFSLLKPSSCPPSFVDEKRKWMKKAILEQILDIPCRSILIRSSKYSVVAYLLSFRYLYGCALIHIWWLSLCCCCRCHCRCCWWRHECKTFMLIDH